MKLDQLRKIIREEVRAAVKEELQEVMNEAVKHASTPAKMQQVPKGQPKKWSVGKSATLDEMLQATKKNMTAEEAKNIMGYQAPAAPSMASSMANQMGMTQPSGPMPGIDISKLDFVSKAKSVLDASYVKDKAKI
tara:strand:- start:2085 stop:2489 length:405 start_codon:yes stop_codon:yes gene_type:complete